MRYEIRSSQEQTNPSPLLYTLGTKRLPGQQMEGPSVYGERHTRHGFAIVDFLPETGKKITLSKTYGKHGRDLHVQVDLPTGEVEVNEEGNEVPIIVRRQKKFSIGGKLDAEKHEELLWFIDPKETATTEEIKNFDDGLIFVWSAPEKYQDLIDKRGVQIASV